MEHCLTLEQIVNGKAHKSGESSVEETRKSESNEIRPCILSTLCKGYFVHICCNFRSKSYWFRSIATPIRIVCFKVNFHHEILLDLKIRTRNWRNG